MKLSDLKPGDKATVEIKLKSVGPTTTYFDVGGLPTGNAVFHSVAENIEVTNAVRKAVTPAAGQVWARSISGHECKLVFVDSISALFETTYPGDKTPSRNVVSIPHLKEYFTFVR